MARTRRHPPLRIYQNNRLMGYLLKSLRQAPLGLSRDDDFRISVAGAQEKTALLQVDGQWFKPHGTTPTTHLFKTQIGKLPNGIDLSNSVENEFYCLKLLKHLGLPADDHRTLFQTQSVFWLIGATDGHAKNFSLFLYPGGGCALHASVSAGIRRRMRVLSTGLGL